MAASITIPIKGGKLTIKAKRDLGKASNAELVSVYNKLSSKKVKKFADKTAAADRVWELLCEANPSLGKARPKGAAAPKKKGKATGTRTSGPMNYPVNKPIKAHREGTARADVIRLLSRKNGATVAECEKATGWDTQTAREGIRILHSRLGYGIKEDDNGRIRLAS